MGPVLITDPPRDDDYPAGSSPSVKDVDTVVEGEFVELDHARHDAGRAQVGQSTMGRVLTPTVPFANAAHAQEDTGEAATHPEVLPEGVGDVAPPKTPPVAPAPAAPPPLQPDRDDMALFSAFGAGAEMVERQARSYLATLLGEEPDEDTQVMLSQELRSILAEARVQGLVMEAERAQTAYALDRVAELQERALAATMRELMRIKEYERMFQWAETPEERLEMQEQSRHLRAHARETYRRTLDMGLRRIDEMLDRPLHPADPDFPARAPRGTLFERLRDALRRPGP